ncbi:MAG: glycosyl hydrolase [Chloroflexi bacterium]|nr:MAG: glycosyl hydrolase [Chloroflexota bacterium]
MATDILKGLKFRSIGPTRGGRVVAVTGHPTDLGTFYFGSTGGGVWKTDDAGLFWRNVSDGYFKRASVGAIALSPSDPNVLYVGMGETTIRGNVSHGDGVYKSTDGGKTWTHLGLEKTRGIGKVRIHPNNPDLVYVAAFGHAHGPNPERGLYRSTDGGKTWDLRLFRSERAGANDISLDPNNPRILFVGFWEAERGPHYMSSGGPGSALFRSFDGGETFEDLEDKPGIPKGIKGKIAVVVSPAKAGRVWAMIEHEDGGVFRSDDYGDTWQRTCDNRDLRQRAWYYSHIYADPQDPNTVWVLNVETWRSIDGGVTFQQVPVPHGDNHDMWIDPANPRRMIIGNDGGGTVSLNGGQSWSTLYNQPTGEFYHVTVDNRTPYRVYGAQQDNTTMSVPSASNYDAIIFPEWYEIGGGESGYIAVRPDDPNIVYAGSMQGYLTRYDHAKGSLRNITVWPESYMGWGAKDMKYRFQWTSPTIISPHDHNVLITGANVVFRSTDEGHSWTPISHDLTRGDPETLGPSGGPITKDNTGAEVYGTVFTIAESPLTPGVIWAGSDDGLVHISRDGGASWEDATPRDIPDWALMSLIEASPHDAATAYLAATRYKLDDFKPYIYKTNDYGKTWTKITNGIPEDVFTRVVREDPARKGLLYAGTEVGIYISFDDGANWAPMTGTLPVVPIHDLIVHGSDLVVGTHGRSFWILDDLTPLHQLKDDLDAVTLFKPRDTQRLSHLYGFGHNPIPGRNYHFAGGFIPAFNYSTDEDGNTNITFIDAGNNPPPGVLIHYYLKEKAEGPVTLTILDAAGNEVRSFTNKVEPKEGEEAAPGPYVSARAGFHRFAWNMRYADATKIATKGGDQPSVSGPLAPPGEYQVRLTVGDTSVTQSFRITGDPRTNTSQADYEAQFALLLKIRDKLSELNAAVNRIRAAKEQIDGWMKRAGEGAISETGKAAKAKLQAIEDEFLQTKAQGMQDTLNFPVKLNSKLATLGGAVAGAEAAPTVQMQELYAELAGKIDTQLVAVEVAFANEVAAFNAAVREANLSAVVV